MKSVIAPPIALHLDRSHESRLYFERNGQRVGIEQALEEGFVVRPDDAPCVVTLTSEFVKNQALAFYLPR